MLKNLGKEDRYRIRHVTFHFRSLPPNKYIATLVNTGLQIYP